MNQNHQMKRETMNTAELEINGNGTFTRLNSMLKYYRQGIDEVNRRFNLDIKISISENWKDSNLSATDDIDDIEEIEDIEDIEEIEKKEGEHEDN